MQDTFILRIDSFDGEDSHVHVGDDEQDFLYCIVKVRHDGSAVIVDSAYRSYEEAAEAWPEAAARV